MADRWRLTAQTGPRPRQTQTTLSLSEVILVSVQHINYALLTLQKRCLGNGLNIIRTSMLKMMEKTGQVCISWHGCSFLHSAAFQNKKFCNKRLLQIPLPHFKCRHCYRGSDRLSAFCCSHTHSLPLKTFWLVTA